MEVLKIIPDGEHNSTAFPLVPGKIIHQGINLEVIFHSGEDPHYSVVSEMFHVRLDGKPYCLPIGQDGQSVTVYKTADTQSPVPVSSPKIEGVPTI